MSADPNAIPALRARSPAAPLHLPRRALGLVVPVLLLGGVEFAVRGGWVSSHLLPAPSDVVQALFNLGAADVAGHVAASSLRVAVGFLIGALLALGVGALVGLSRMAQALLDPSFQALRAIPVPGLGGRCCCCGWASTRHPSSC